MNMLRAHVNSLISLHDGLVSLCGRLRAGALIIALCITAPLVSCAGREADEPFVNTDAVTPGASAAASEEEHGRDVPSPDSTHGAGARDFLPPGSHVASASRDDDTWFLVTDVNAEREFAVYVDTSTIQTIDGEVYSWSRLVFDEDQRDSDGLVYREVMISSAIDCAKNTYSYKSSKFYDSLGRMVFMENVATNTSKIPEKSVSRHIADFVCGYDPSDAKKSAPASPQQKSK